MAENFESVKLRCLVDTERGHRNDCPQYEENPSSPGGRRENLRKTEAARFAMSNAREIERVKKVIRTKFMPRGKFTMQDVYMDDSDPGDLDMYQALDEMVDAGELLGPLTTDPTFSSHDVMKYRRAKTACKADCACMKDGEDEEDKGKEATLLQDLITLAYHNKNVQSALLPIIQKHKK
jgi:hypothetical protein